MAPTTSVHKIKTIDPDGFPHQNSDSNVDKELLDQLLTEDFLGLDARGHDEKKTEDEDEDEELEPKMSADLSLDQWLDDALSPSAPEKSQSGSAQLPLATPQSSTNKPNHNKIAETPSTIATACDQDSLSSPELSPIKTSLQTPPKTPNRNTKPNKPSTRGRNQPTPTTNKTRSVSPQAVARQRIRQYKVKGNQQHVDHKARATHSLAANNPPVRGRQRVEISSNKTNKTSTSRNKDNNKNRSVSPQKVAKDRIREYKIKEQQLQQEEARQRQEEERTKSPPRVFKWTAAQGHLRAQTRVMIRENLRQEQKENHGNAMSPPRINKTKSTRPLSPRRTAKEGEMGSSTWEPTVPRAPKFTLDKKYGVAKKPSNTIRGTTTQQSSKKYSAGKKKAWTPTVPQGPKFALDAKYGDKTTPRGNPRSSSLNRNSVQSTSQRNLNDAYETQADHGKTIV
eukprot:CAMPEP_0168756366 /NCGR_PEP_ID=MMETSP0724-20121128/20574_1 /TAXON_ID=265536 /ORGANISM="Amphiprora sp., Strain CCMP467" /LENGTH=452 /DNA_ID=CAMNT_0008805063 /DNA_START=149 /DNA_END=1507 /DNA_ORIENTATION=+